jgi:hypothetical protein
MSDNDIVELLVLLEPSEQAVAWLASVISDPIKAAGVNELSRRYVSTSTGRCRLPRAKSAGTVLIDGAKFKEFFWRHRIPLTAVGPMASKCPGYASVVAHKGRLSYWTADAIATELGMHVDEFIAAIASNEELSRLSA